MQTFLAFENFAHSAAALDRQRLGKQRVETLQIMNALMTGRGWVNHPATKMWRRCEWFLLQYQEAMCHEWVHERGYVDTCLKKTKQVYSDNLTWTEGYLEPPWLGDVRLHISHQSNLKRKFPEHYNELFPGVSNHLDYFWPTSVPEYAETVSRAKQRL